MIWFWNLVITLVRSHLPNWQLISIPTLSPREPPIYFSISVNLIILDISSKWNSIKHGLLWLASHFAVFLKFVYVAASISFAFFYCWTVFIVWLFHISFTSSQAGGHLDRFHFLVMMNNAAENISVQVFVWSMLSFLLVRCPGIELLDYMVKLCVLFKKNCHDFSKWPHHFIFSTTRSVGRTMYVLVFIFLSTYVIIFFSFILLFLNFQLHWDIIDIKL